VSRRVGQKETAPKLTVVRPSAMSYDITIWEQIRTRVERCTRTLVEDIGSQIARDLSLLEHHGSYPVPWQLGEIMQQRAQSWIQRLYDLCCDAYERMGKELSVEFDKAVWAFCLEPFVMKEVETNSYGYKASTLLELLLCAVGSPPEKRNLLKVGQKDCCLTVRLHIFETWYDKLHHLPPRINAVVAALARHRETETHAARIVRGLAPYPASQSRGSTSPGLPVTTKQSIEASAEHSNSSPRAATESGIKLASADLHQAADTSERSQEPKIEVEAGWEQIEITFLSDERVQIRSAKSIETRNYAEFGFQDGRNQNPNRAWETLRRFAELRGIIRDPKDALLPWPKVEKRAQEIRKVFREHFRISSDPIPFVEGTGYRTLFKISCGPSYRS
jgi:hypothetical protein